MRKSNKTKISLIIIIRVLLIITIVKILMSKILNMHNIEQNFKPSVKPEKNSIFLKNGKTVISVENLKFF